MKLEVMKTKIGVFFTMTIGYWNSGRTYYRSTGTANILLSEVVGLKNWMSSSGNIICEVILKTGKNLGLNGYSNSFEIPTEEYDAIWEYLQESEEK